MSQLLSVAQELLPAGTDLPDELSVAIGEVYVVIVLCLRFNFCVQFFVLFI